MQVVTKRVDYVPGVRGHDTRDYRVISFYQDPPREELSIDEFEIFACGRLQLLRTIEKIKLKRQDEANNKESSLEINRKIDQVS